MAANEAAQAEEPMIGAGCDTAAATTPTATATAATATATAPTATATATTAATAAATAAATTADAKVMNSCHCFPTLQQHCLPTAATTTNYI